MASKAVVAEIGKGPIRTEEDYAQALERAKECYYSEPGSDDYKRFEIIMHRVEEYERSNGIEPEDDWHKCLRIAGRLAMLRESHCPPPWKVVQLEGFFAENFLVGQKKYIGARIMGGLSGIYVSNALAQLPDDVEWLLKRVFKQLNEQCQSDTKT